MFELYYKKKLNMKKSMMKMFAAAGIAAGTVFSANAQVSSGSMMFGGSLGADISMEKTTKSTAVGASDVKMPGHTDWNFSPTFGYFVSDGLAVGVNLSIGSSFKKIVTTNDKKISEHISESLMGVGLFVRKYMTINDKLYLHGQVGLNYASGSYTDRETDGADKLKDLGKVTETSMGINITPGLTYFVAPSWGIDFSLNNIISYNTKTTKTEVPVAGAVSAYTNETSGGSFSIGAGLTPSLGLFYYLGK